MILSSAVTERLGFLETSGLLSEAPRDQSRSKDREAPASTQTKNELARANALARK